MSSPVAPTSAQYFERHRGRFVNDFPIGALLEEALRSAENPTPFFFFFKSQLPDLRNCWIVLGRLGRQLEKTFSISGEVLLLFSPHEDLQRRTFNALTEGARNEAMSRQRDIFKTVRFTPDKRLSFIWSPDAKMKASITAWNLDGSRSLVVPIPNLGSPADLSHLRSAIAAVAAQRDLYRGRNPVWGSEFFGRDELMRTTEASLRAGHSVGLFGLRRSGKTSVLRQLQQRFEAMGTVVVLVDLETIGSLDETPIQISESALDALRRMRSIDSRTWLGPELSHTTETFARLSDRLKRISEKNSHLTIVIAIDEIENLKRLSVGNMTQVRSLLGALRRASQSVPNLSLLLTGITSEYFESSRLDEEADNPLFGFVEPAYLGSFDLGETKSLLTSLGELMLLTWDDEALTRVHDLSGGFPFFVRDLASAVASQARRRQASGSSILQQQVLLDDVDTAVVDWRSEAAMLWSEIVAALDHYHPIMAEICRTTSDDSVREWLELGEESDQAQRALIHLGLLERGSDGTICRSDVLRRFQDFAIPATMSLSELRAREDTRSHIRKLTSSPESMNLEFKSSAKVSLTTGQADRAVTREIVKTVAAFLNASGGDLLVGVADDGALLGVAKDVAASKGSWDKYLLWLTNSILIEALGATVVSTLVSIEVANLEGVEILDIQVSKSKEPIWVTWDNKEHLFVRIENLTKELTGRDIARFTLTRHGEP